MGPPIVLQKVGDLFIGKAEWKERGLQWEAPRPMTQGEIVAELTTLGFHQIDIGDALFMADPTFLADDPTVQRHEHLRRTRQPK
jgi:hypothetical protein